MSARSDMPLDTLPGFRRRFVVTPAPGQVSTAVEDDFHHMEVTIHHAGGIATRIEPTMHRAPWTTCPGAPAELMRTFTGIALADFAARGEKTRNCTHLHDLATLAAAHAGDRDVLVYDILVSDPIDGRQRAELRRNGEMVMSWAFENDRFVAPAELKGLTLYDLRDWIASLGPDQQEQARIFRWGTMIAHGRVLPMEQQSDARQMPPNCHTFQPQNAAHARRIVDLRDFSTGALQPLQDRVPPHLKPKKLA